MSKSWFWGLILLGVGSIVGWFLDFIFGGLWKLIGTWWGASIVVLGIPVLCIWVFYIAFKGKKLPKEDLEMKEGAEAGLGKTEQKPSTPISKEPEVWASAKSLETARRGSQASFSASAKATRRWDGGRFIGPF